MRNIRNDATERQVLQDVRKQKRGDGMSGFYFAHRLTDEIGLSFAVVYIPEERGLQISLMLGCLMLAIGYNGKEVTK